MTESEAPKPYKGPESYKSEDSALFFGRDREADQLIARILSSRFTLLHAQSGAGKSSLVNAKVIPGLDSRGWYPIRVLPQSDPVESIRVATIQTLFPPPSIERAALQEAWHALAPGSKDLRLSDLLSRYDALDVRQPLHRNLVKRRPESSAVKGSPFPLFGEFEPMFGRLLRGSFDVGRFSEHLNALSQLCNDSPGHQPLLEGDCWMSAVLDRIKAVEQRVGLQEIVNHFYAPVPDLHAFFQNIAELYGKRLSKFGIVLIMDQFEELFTRFVDTGSLAPDLPSTALDWHLRWELFHEMKTLYLSKTAEGQLLPIRYVISMRDEYIAQLDPLRQFVPELDSTAYHLTLLTREAAQAAVREPALLFGYGYSEECFREILDQLTKEDRFLEPTHLQIVCEKLWFCRGRELAAGPLYPTAPFPTIGAEELKKLNGAAGILRSFFREFLDELNPEMRVEALELLELLVTSTGTRNIVERSDLTHPKFRKPSLREYLLSKLESRTIVRIENRLGGQFAEITHEFLIGPILEALRDELTSNPDYSRFRYAVRVLEMLEGVEFRGRRGRLLGEQEFHAVDQFRNRFHWEDWSTELMLRSALALGVDHGELEIWQKQFESRSFEPNSVRTSLEVGRGVGRQMLTLQELRALSLRLDLPGGGAEERILRSVLHLAADHERFEVVNWTRRLIIHGTS